VYLPCTRDTPRDKLAYVCGRVSYDALAFKMRFFAPELIVSVDCDFRWRVYELEGCLNESRCLDVGQDVYAHAMLTLSYTDCD